MWLNSLQLALFSFRAGEFDKLHKTHGQVHENMSKNTVPVHEECVSGGDSASRSCAQTQLL